MEGNKVGIIPFELGLSLVGKFKEALAKAQADDKIDINDTGILFEFLFSQVAPFIKEFKNLSEAWNDLWFDEIVTDLAGEFEVNISDEEADLMLFTGIVCLVRGGQLKFFNDAKQTEVDNEEE